MDFTLKIEFVGVCMFVPDPREKMYYVLMPGTGHEDHEEHGAYVPPHVVRLCVDTAYLVKGSSGPSGVFALAAMDGLDLSFGTRGPAIGLPLALPADVVDVGAEPPRRIIPALLGDAPSPALAGRTRLLSGTYVPPVPGDGVCWTYEGKDGRLVNRMGWTIDCKGESLTLPPGTPFDKKVSAPQIPTLYPVNGVIEVSIYHTTREDLPPHPDNRHPRPGLGDPANHFDAYYSLFTAENVREPVPGFLDDCGGARKWGGSPYTCMLAQAPPV
jgi:hypothetical protein